MRTGLVLTVLALATIAVYAADPPPAGKTGTITWGANGSPSGSPFPGTIVTSDSGRIATITETHLGPPYITAWVFLDLDPVGDGNFQDAPDDWRVKTWLLDGVWHIAVIDVTPHPDVWYTGTITWNP